MLTLATVIACSDESTSPCPDSVLGLAHVPQPSRAGLVFSPYKWRRTSGVELSFLDPKSDVAAKTLIPWVSVARLVIRSENVRSGAVKLYSQHGREAELDAALLTKQVTPRIHVGKRK